VSRAIRIPLAAAGVLLLGMAVVWAFDQYAGAHASSFLRATPLPCPFHPWR
jgi:hypothetical protein